MKKDYQVYKKHYNNKFIGWQVGEGKRDKNDIIVDVKEIALFYNPNAKEHAERFVDSVLEF